MQITRRAVLGAGAAVTTLGIAARPSYAADLAPFPFTLGVASGDPRPDGVTLWTRLAPEPLTIDGGMPATHYEVVWQVATDEAMADVVKAGAVRARPAEAHSVHVDVRGLAPDRHYWYRFRVGRHVSRIGRTRTFPAAGAAVGSLRFATMSCQNLPAGRFAAYRHLAQQDVDVVVHLGDYIYEGRGPAVPAPGWDRRHEPFRTLQTLEEYRVRHAQYRTDADLQDAHAAHPFLVVPDDHEVVNNMHRGTRDARKAAGYQAYWEHMPLAASARPTGAAIQLFRTLEYGSLARFDMLDTRQYRSPLIPGATFRELPGEAYDPSRTLTGAGQERWLFDGLAASGATWNVLAQQVYMAAIDVDPTEGTAYNADKWDGYPLARERLTRFLHEARPRNPVVLAGDVHAAMVNDITLRNANGTPVVATEFLGSSVTSGKGNDQLFVEAIADNPEMLFYNGSQRGYLICEATPEQFRGDLWFVDDVLRADSAVRLQASYALDDGVLGAHRV